MNMLLFADQLSNFKNSVALPSRTFNRIIKLSHHKEGVLWSMSTGSNSTSFVNFNHYLKVVETASITRFFECQMRNIQWNGMSSRSFYQPNAVPKVVVVTGIVRGADGTSSRWWSQAYVLPTLIGFNWKRDRWIKCDPKFPPKDIFNNITNFCIQFRITLKLMRNQFHGQRKSLTVQLNLWPVMRIEFYTKVWNDRITS